MKTQTDHPTIHTTCIIDDDPIFVFVTKKFMQAEDFCEEFLEFENGQRALAHFERRVQENAELPNLVLLDLNMPVLDGWGFLEEFIKLKTQQTIYIYIVTSSVDPEDVKRAEYYSKTIKNYIVKPISRDNVKEILEDIKSTRI